MLLARKPASNPCLHLLRNPPLSADPDCTVDEELVRLMEGRHDPDLGFACLCDIFCKVLTGQSGSNNGPCHRLNHLQLKAHGGGLRLRGGLELKSTGLEEQPDKLLARPVALAEAAGDPQPQRSRTSSSLEALLW
ncbi:unnamed protein product [Pleuronectes platessa]|uniref:Uncharacterized protein n=1 Tax=Pleuronectes platessa TaxID=8262 RepID=A0A9N7TVN9_PLEPL|nr:unnamed protein product [Pleuronectes platessa]